MSVSNKDIDALLVESFRITSLSEAMRVIDNMRPIVASLRAERNRLLHDLEEIEKIDMDDGR